MSANGIAQGDIVSQVLHEEGQALLIDVRQPAEYRAEHVAHSVNVPLAQLVEWTTSHRAEVESHNEVFLLCQGGVRAAQAREQLRAAGFANISCVEGGINRWKELGLATEIGPYTLPLDRQMRIGAGTLVGVGTTLAFMLSPWWLLLPAFVGGGLIFSGITGRCGMMKMMAMMPWNH